MEWNQIESIFEEASRFHYGLNILLLCDTLLDDGQPAMAANPLHTQWVKVWWLSPEVRIFDLQDEI